MNTANQMPRVINVDKNRSYPVAAEALTQGGALRRGCKLRQCDCLNNIVEQDHRTVRRRTWLANRYGSVAIAWRTLRGIEAMEMIRKGESEAGGEG